MQQATTAEEEFGSRVTSDDKSFLSAAIAIAVLVILLTGAVYFFFFARAKTAEVTGFDPNRPVPTDEVLRKRLSPEQWHVVREAGTETAFQNKLWNNVRDGIYCDIITGEPLFSSADKFDGQTGRPTFTQPLNKDAIVEKMDTSHDMQRTEVCAKRSNAHLGHLFPDPTSPTKVRYAVNSAAFRFIPVEQMKEAGYESFLSLFPQASPAAAK
jgi:peptide-methionine (R)-S-oxide reductase